MISLRMVRHVSGRDMARFYIFWCSGLEPQQNLVCWNGQLTSLHYSPWKLGTLSLIADVSISFDVDIFLRLSMLLIGASTPRWCTISTVRHQISQSSQRLLLGVSIVVIIVDSTLPGTLSLLDHLRGASTTHYQMPYPLRYFCLECRCYLTMFSIA